MSFIEAEEDWRIRKKRVRLQECDAPDKGWVLLSFPPIHEIVTIRGGGGSGGNGECNDALFHDVDSIEDSSVV